MAEDKRHKRYRQDDSRAVINWNEIKDVFSVFVQWKRPPLDIQPGEDINQILGRLRSPIIVMILILTFGTLGYMAIDDYSPLNALYMTVITIATVGYGEIAPTSPEGRIFSMVLIFSGIAGFGYSMGIFVSIISDGHLIRSLGERHMVKQIGLLDQHFIICGLNETSQEIIKQFQKKKIPFVVIDSFLDFDMKSLELKIEYHINGDPFSDVTLRKAHISTCRGVIAASPNDNDNFAIVVSAKILLEKFENKSAYIYSVAKDIENKEKLLKIGARHVITPQIIAGQRLVSYAIKPDASHFVDDVIYSDETDVDLEEMEIKDINNFPGRHIKDMELKAFDLMVFAIKREKEILTQISGDTGIQQGDVLLVIGKIKDMQKYLKKYAEKFA